MACAAFSPGHAAPVPVFLLPDVVLLQVYLLLSDVPRRLLVSPLLSDARRLQVFPLLSDVLFLLTVSPLLSDARRLRVSLLRLNVPRCRCRPLNDRPLHCLNPFRICPYLFPLFLLFYDTRDKNHPARL